MEEPIRTTWHSDHVDADTIEDGKGYDHWDSENRKPVPPEDANLISSLCTDGLHAPVIDLDFTAKLVPSTTPGHFHLYLDKKLPWGDYYKLLEVLRQVGLIQPGFYNASINKNGSFVRPPWVKKQAKKEEKDE